MTYSDWRLFHTDDRVLRALKRTNNGRWALVTVSPIDRLSSIDLMDIVSQTEFFDSNDTSLLESLLRYTSDESLAGFIDQALQIICREGTNGGKTT